ncbi:hypothetical protein B9Z19DRAFT_1131259 [Tuber borchii]|uniref:Uncharacterized protein n=1 Tax=Tuber borchii TaxID=42251 RepID=A0A2T6ZIY2_TUBBO|nr:hypothetical protein B9Z19DRAFT_1131259 [Tuber borchii]
MPRGTLHHSPQPQVHHLRRGIATALRYNTENGSRLCISGLLGSARTTSAFGSPVDNRQNSTRDYFGHLSNDSLVLRAHLAHRNAGQNVMGGKLITDLVALGSKGVAVKVNNHTVSNKREYHFNRVDPYPTAPSTWTDILLPIFVIASTVFMVCILLPFAFCLGILARFIQIVESNKQQEDSKRSR